MHGVTMKKKKLTLLIDQLGVHYDKFPCEAQDTYEKICKILNTKQYKIYSNSFIDSEFSYET